MRRMRSTFWAKLSTKCGSNGSCPKCNKSANGQTRNYKIRWSPWWKYHPRRKPKCNNRKLTSKDSLRFLLALVGGCVREWKASMQWFVTRQTMGSCTWYLCRRFEVSTIFGFLFESLIWKCVTRYDEHFIAALFGRTLVPVNRLEHLNEQVSRVSCVKSVPGSDLALLYLEFPVRFSRYTLPTFLADK